MTYFTVAAIAVLSAILPSTRIYSVICTGILLYFYPVPTIGILLTGGAAFFYFFHK